MADRSAVEPVINYWDGHFSLLLQIAKTKSQTWMTHACDGRLKQEMSNEVMEIDFWSYLV